MVISEASLLEVEIEGEEGELVHGETIFIVS